MENIFIPLPFTIDLARPLEKTLLHTLFCMGDKNAHRFELTINILGAAQSLEGCSVVGSFLSFETMTTHRITGTVTEGKAVVVLDDFCYSLHGQFALTVKIKEGEAETSVFCGEGYMRTTMSEKVVTDDYILMDVETIVTKIEAAEKATSRANTAAARCENMQMDASGMAGDSNRLNGKDPAHYLPARNLLDNSNFTNPVNQRGNTTYTGAGAIIDRWKVQYNNNGSASIIKGGITFKNESESMNYPVAQHFPAGTLEDGEKYTAAFRTWAGYTYSYVFTAEENCNLYSNLLATCIYIHMQKNTENGTDLFEILLTPAKTLTIAWAALYEGEYSAENIPPYVPKGYAAELIEAQRHLTIYTLSGTYLVPFAHGYCYSATMARFCIDLPAPMRMLVPTVTADNVTLRIRANGSVYPVTEVGVINCRNNKAYLTATAEGLPEGYPCEIIASNVSGNTGVFAISAEV